MLTEISSIVPLRRLGQRCVSRRDFLRRTCCTASAVGLAGAFGRLGVIDALAQAVGGYKALVCVFLFGGNDANNMLVPMDAAGYRAYAAARGPLALPSTSLLPLLSASESGAFGLHPGMPLLQQLFGRGRLGI